MGHPALNIPTLASLEWGTRLLQLSSYLPLAKMSFER